MQDITLVLLAMVKMAKIFVACAVPGAAILFASLYIWVKLTPEKGR